MYDQPISERLNEHEVELLPNFQKASFGDFMRTRSWMSSQELGERQWMEAINVEGRGWTVIKRKWSPAIHEDVNLRSRHGLYNRRGVELIDEVTGNIESHNLSFFEAVDKLANFDMVEQDVHHGMEDSFDEAVLEQDFYYRNFAEREAIAFDADGLPHPTVNGRVVSEATFAGFTPDQVQERHDDKAAVMASYVTILDPNDLTIDAPDLYEEYDSLSEVTKELRLSAHYFKLCLEQGWHVDPDEDDKKDEENPHYRRTPLHKKAEKHWDRAKDEVGSLNRNDNVNVKTMLSNSVIRLNALYRFYYCVTAASAIAVKRDEMAKKPLENHNMDDAAREFYMRRNQTDYMSRAKKNLENLGVHEDKAKHYVRYAVMKAVNEGQVSYPQAEIDPLFTWLDKTLDKMMQDAAITPLDEVIDLREVSLPYPDLGDVAKARKEAEPQVQEQTAKKAKLPVPRKA